MRPRHAEVGDQASSGALTNGTDSRYGRRLVRERFGYGDNCPVRCLQPEPECIVSIMKKFDHRGHEFPLFVRPGQKNCAGSSSKPEHNAASGWPGNGIGLAPCDPSHTHS